MPARVVRNFCREGFVHRAGTSWCPVNSTGSRFSGCFLLVSRCFGHGFVERPVGIFAGATEAFGKQPPGEYAAPNDSF
ncbi:hypothetical protein SAMN02745674_02899, partial [Lysobacter spongiicola DSM 21749]